MYKTMSQVPKDKLYFWAKKVTGWSWEPPEVKAPQAEMQSVINAISAVSLHHEHFHAT